MRRRETEDSYIVCSQSSRWTKMSRYFSLMKSQGLEWEFERDRKFRTKHCGELAESIQEQYKYAGIG